MSKPEGIGGAGGAASVRSQVDPTDPVFAGHYPGFPVFPGTCVVERVHRSASSVPPAGLGAVALVGIDSARFRSAVFPGDELTVELDWSPDGGQWLCTAEVHTARGQAARVRLRYRAVPLAPGTLDSGPLGSDRRGAGSASLRPLTGDGRPVENGWAGPGTLSFEGIRGLLSQRYPILLLDRVVAMTPGVRLTARKAVSGNEPWYGDLPEGLPAGGYAYPPSLLVESWCQAVGVLMIYESGAPADRVLLLGALAGVRLTEPVFPGDLVEHRVRQIRSAGETTIFAGESTVDSRVVLEVDKVVVALRPADTLVPSPAGGERTR